MDYWFSIKKLLSIYLNPVTVTLELVFLGVVLIGLASRKPRKPLGPKMTRLRAHLGDFGVFFVILGILRYLQLTLVFDRTESPTRALLRDGFLQIVLLGWIGAFAWLLYGRKFLGF